MSVCFSKHGGVNGYFTCGANFGEKKVDNQLTCKQDKCGQPADSQARIYIYIYLSLSLSLSSPSLIDVLWKEGETVELLRTSCIFPPLVGAGGVSVDGVGAWRPKFKIGPHIGQYIVESVASVSHTFMWYRPSGYRTQSLHFKTPQTPYRKIGGYL